MELASCPAVFRLQEEECLGRLGRLGARGYYGISVVYVTT